MKIDEAALEAAMAKLYDFEFWQGCSWALMKKHTTAAIKTYLSLTATAEPGEGWRDLLAGEWPGGFTISKDQSLAGMVESIREGVRKLARKATPPQPQPADRKGLVERLRDAANGKEYLPEESDALMLEAATALSQAPSGSEGEAIAWESTTLGYIKFVTESRYRKFSPAAQRWYKPYRCSNCPRTNAAEEGK